MAIDNVVLGEEVDPAWGNAVADQLNNLPPEVQFGTTTITTDANGRDVITFPEAFGTADTVVVASIATSTAYFCNVFAANATTFTVEMNDTSGNPVTSTSRDIRWMAMGAA